jgi:16S rRNA processing protein RimM
VLVGEREMTIAARRGSAARPLLELEGVRGRDGVAGLVGTELRVPRETLGPLAEGEYLVEDLIGLEVADRGRRVGRVRDVLLLPSVDCLEVEPEDGGAQPLLVPFLREAVRSLDLEAGRVDVDLGFVEVEPREHHGGCAAT